MDHHIDIAWALEIPHAQLGARLEAYIETKPTITAFRACLRQLRLPPKAEIPPEILQMILNALRDATYEPKISMWDQGRRCLQDDCETVDHFTRDYIADYKFTHPSEIDELLWKERTEQHLITVEDYLLKFEPPKSPESRKFAMYKAIFAEDFGIAPYFEVLKTYEMQYQIPEFKYAEISGFLTQSVIGVPVWSRSGPNRVSYSIQHSLDQEVLSQKMSAKTKQQFLKAVKALRLEVAHIHTHVEIERSYEQEFQSCLSGTGRMDEYEEDSAAIVSLSNERENNEEEQDEEEQNEEEQSKIEIMSCGCTLRTRESWGLEFKYKTRCIDCGTEICEGRFRASEPKLMLVGSEELKCYSVK